MTPCEPEAMLARTLHQTRRHFFARLRPRARLDGPCVAVSATADRPRAAAEPGSRTRWPRARAFPGAGEERDLPVHGRRPQPARAVRLQARAPGVSRPADSRLVHQGPAVRLHGQVHQGTSQAAGHESQVRPARCGRARGSRSSCRTWPRVVDDLAFVRNRWRPTSSTTRRPSSSPTPARSSSAGPAWGPGSPTASAASRQDLPGFVVLQSGPRGPRGGAVNWGSGFLPTSYQGVPLRSGGEPILEPEPRHRGSRGARQRRAIDAIRRARTRPAWTPRPTPRSPPGSPPTRWPTGCRPVHPN